jgi:hypothetical protein
MNIASRKPTQVRSATGENNSPDEPDNDQPVLNADQHPTLSISEDILRTVTENTADLQTKLQTFIDGINSKITTVRKTSMVAGELTGG